MTRVRYFIEEYKKNLSFVFCDLFLSERPYDNFFFKYENEDYL
jgi:hypothetical protein